VRKKIRATAALLVLVAALAPRAAAETVTVDQIGFYWSPREVVIQPGDTVRWVWHSSSHTVTEGTDGLINGNELFTSSLTSGNPVFQFTFTPAFLAAHPHPSGRYDFFCSPHFSIQMTGIVWVVDPAPGTEFCAGNGSGTACPCGNTPVQPVGCLNSIGAGGRLRARGTASVSADTLLLVGTGMSESTTVLFFQGSTQVNGGMGAVFGDGLRCAGGASIRLGVSTVSFGVARYPQAGNPAVSVKGVVPAGGMRTYQIFYRDPPSACTGALFNASDGYAITWMP
jgi:plastocyanin